MMGKEDPELTSSHGLTKTITIYRKSIDGKKKTYHKTSSTTEDIKKEPQQDGGKGRNLSVLRPTSSGG